MIRWRTKDKNVHWINGHICCHMLSTSLSPFVKLAFIIYIDYLYVFKNK